MGLLGKGFHTGDALLGLFGVPASTLIARRDQRRDNQLQDEKAKREKQIIDDLVAQAQAAGASPAEIAAIRANPGKYAEEALTRFRTRDISPGTEIVTPGFGNNRQVYRSAEAPPAIQRNVDYLRSIGRDDLAEALIAKEATLPITVTNPATGAVELHGINPAQLYPGRQSNFGPPANAPRLPGAAGASPVPAAAPMGAAGNPLLDRLFNSVIQQESGGRPGIPGQMTRYGRPMGMAQMLPGTAREMAGKVGLPFDSALLARTDQQGADYQRQLGRAYLQQGMDETGGDPRQAAMYYHGGPNRRMWGPKTRRYADQVMSRMGSQPIRVTSEGQLNALPSGTEFIGPDGVVRRKQ